jgi:aquaporin Z
MDLDNHQLAWRTYIAELAGTALLVAVGLSVVILSFGQGSPVVQLIPSTGLRCLITGFLFGSTLTAGRGRALQLKLADVPR